MENEIGKYIVGHEDVIRKVLIAIIAEGHVIIEGMPGTGKTQLVNTIADAINLTFRRISFAPDIMPADITGCDVLIEDRDTGKRTKEFQEGPIFTNLLLADEINRGHPRVHSALLEAMQERKVTYSNLVHLLPRPFFVLATMNPLEQDAVYALPEAQQDRFLFKLLVDYTKPADDMEILNRTTGEQIPIVENVCDGETIIRMSRLARKVPIAKCVQAYTIRLTHATRPNGIYLPVPDVTKQLVRVGASPRAEQAMVLAGKIRALAEGRLNVSFEDIQADAPDVLRHRLIFNLEGEHYPPDDIIKAIMEHVSPYERYDPEIFDKEKKEE
ncbi:MAG: MoxR family ATPase [Candidatus Levybacteria bacterium]|nr:MoxR family ATPase [Candidatus Levybacteria bacterium]